MNDRGASDADVQDGEPLSRAVLDGLDQVVVVFDGEGDATWCNATARSVADHAGDEGTAPAVTTMVADHDRTLARAAVDRLVETGDLSVQLELETPDGQRRPYEFRGTAFDPPEDRPAYVAIGYAIADRRERERKLDALRTRTLELMATETKAETAKLAVEAAHTIIEAPLSGIHFPDSAGDRLAPVAVVDSVEEAFGEPPSYPSDAPSGSRAATVWSVFEGGESLRIDDVAAHDGITEGTPTGSVILHPLGDHGLFIVSAPEPNAFDDTDSALVDILAGALRAALDRVEREGELRRQNERLDRFTSIVSHDMRNPLSTAQGYLELARETGDDAYLENVAESLDRMESLVDDLLTLAREGEESISRERVDLADLAERSWGDVKTGGATLQVETTTSVRGDETRLRQLFENLFRNSVEHGSTGSQTRSDDSVEHGSTSNRTESGDPVEHGSRSEAVEQGDQPGVTPVDGADQRETAPESGVAAGLTITVGDLPDGFYVADDGVGIPELDRDRVLLSGYSTGEGGTGLGLSIVEEVAEAHDWSVTVTESEAGGARFEFRGFDATESD